MEGGDSDDEPDEHTMRRMETVQRVMTKNASNAYETMSSARRLTRELLSIYEAQTFDAELVDDNLYEWVVRITAANLDDTSTLARDAERLHCSIDVRLSFPQDFPFSAPFAFVLRPRVECQYVFEGALCMELLVNWTPSHSAVEAILVQICNALVEGEAHITPNSHDAGEYAESTARATFEGLKSFHAKNGWAKPPPP